ncbi:MAG: DUF2334 domain-containing protein, partial [Syntrophomonadaceae bacterium]|nr:DUF2334 domain-containing protein [Syntrophomonadaceae bacterium]
LRAVVDYLYSQGIPFQVAVIPRFQTLKPDGSWQVAGIDDPAPDPETQAFMRLLSYMEERGGVLGLHGYTHQFGEQKKPDNSQNSGTGDEFNVPGEPASTSVNYARERVEMAFQAFKKTGREPSFWETPHNVATEAQREVFRSAIGIQYESLEKKDLWTVYREEENQFISPTLGSVNVPTPLYYVEGGAGTVHSVERILSRMIFFSGLASFFYHPFLEYPFLEPVYQDDGSPRIVDGLPQYRYREGANSHLQRMVRGLRDWGYQFVSLHEVVPFTPGHRLKAAVNPGSSYLTGDFNGDRQSETLIRDDRQVRVLTARLQLPRWRTATNLQSWLEVPPEQVGAFSFTGDFNGDGRDDLLFYQPQRGDWSIALSEGDRFADPQCWLAGWAKGAGWRVFVGDFEGDGRDDLLVFNQRDGSWQIARNNCSQGFLPQPATFFGLAETSLQMAVGDVNGDRVDDFIVYDTTSGSVRVALVNNLKISPPRVWLNGGEKFGELMVGDFNGDGRYDLLLCLPRSGLWFSAPSDGREFVPLPNAYGPWAAGVKRIGQVGDYDGNGKSDLASLKEYPGEVTIDLAYSFQR